MSTSRLVRSYEEVNFPADPFEWSEDFAEKTTDHNDISRSMVFITDTKVACINESKSKDITFTDLETKESVTLESTPGKIVVAITEELFAVVYDFVVEFRESSTLKLIETLPYEQERSINHKNYTYSKLIHAKMSHDRQHLLVKTWFSPAINVYAIDIKTKAIKKMSLKSSKLTIDMDMLTADSLIYQNHSGIYKYYFANNTVSDLIPCCGTQFFILTPSVWVVSIHGSFGFEDLYVYQANEKGVMVLLEKTIGKICSYHSRPKIIGNSLVFEDEEEGVVEFNGKTLEIKKLAMIDTVQPFRILDCVPGNILGLYYNNGTLLRCELESSAKLNDMPRLTSIQTAFQNTTVSMPAPLAQLISQFAGTRYNKHLPTEPHVVKIQNRLSTY